MPYGRSSYRRKAPARRRTRVVRKKRTGYRLLATKVGKLQRAISAEVRYSNAIQGNTASSTAGTAGVINALILGDNNLTRSGQKILIRRIEVVIRINAHPDTADPDAGIGRFMLIQAKQNNGATTFTPGDFLLNGGSSGNNYLALHKPETVPSKYKVLRDTQVTIAPSSNTRGNVGLTRYDNPYKVIKWVLRFPKGLTTYYNGGNAGTSADIDRNCIFWYSAWNATSAEYDIQWRYFYTP